MGILAFISGIGGGELLFILLVLIILFGTKKIPELARGLGKGICEFRNAIKEEKDEAKEQPSPKKDQ